jgi:molecular chaperone GrpE
MGVREMNVEHETSELDPAAAPAPDAGPSPEDELREELRVTRDQLIRALADQENTRRRTEHKHQEAMRYAAAHLARDLLETADNLHRAIESVPAECKEDDSLRELLAGVIATERALTAAFGRHGIRQISPVGEPFDPRSHQAITAHYDSLHPSGTVVDVVQAGYAMYDRLLRPAMVGVAKGGAGSPEQRGEENASNAQPPPAASS